MTKKVNWLQIIVVFLVIIIILMAMYLLGFTFKDIKEQLDWFLGAISLLAALVGMFAKMTGSIKAARFEKALNQVSEFARDGVETAEEFTNYSGSEKKQFALTKINQLCIENSINFDIEQASNMIEQYVQLSKKVNARHKAEESVGEEIVLE